MLKHQTLFLDDNKASDLRTDKSSFILRQQHTLVFRCVQKNNLLWCTGRIRTILHLFVCRIPSMWMVCSLQQRFLCVYICAIECLSNTIFGLKTNEWIHEMRTSPIGASAQWVCVTPFVWLGLYCVVGPGFPWWGGRYAAMAERHRTSAARIKGCGRLTRHSPRAA